MNNILVKVLCFLLEILLDSTYACRISTYKILELEKIYVVGNTKS